jgi:hypothetical protein
VEKLGSVVPSSFLQAVGQVQAAQQQERSP